MIQEIFRYLHGKRRHSQSEQAKAALVSDAGNPDTTTPAFATGGHPGPSRLASEIDSSLFREILQVGQNRVFQKAAQ
jgi:hypothetical protein